MKIEDWNIVFGSLGKQQNFTLLLSALAIIIFSFAQYLENQGFQSLELLIIKNIAILPAFYYLVYSLSNNGRITNNNIFFFSNFS